MAPGTHIVFDRTTSRPWAYRGPFTQLWRWICLGILKISGWTLEGDWPPYPKGVFICAPHTSNWDGIWMLVAAGAWRFRIRYMGKKSLTEGPFGWLVRWSGCIPVDRSKSNDLVAQMAKAFAAEDVLLLGIPPEGTRGKVERWKSGFYYIALGAGVPLLFAVLDYGTRKIRISGALWPTGDYAKDFEIIRTHYEGAVGKVPEDFTLAI
jgi:1-acyl-sn-glycerol-3-phosphate acyltransferase